MFIFWTKLAVNSLEIPLELFESSDQLGTFGLGIQTVSDNVVKPGDLTVEKGLLRCNLFAKTSFFKMFLFSSPPPPPVVHERESVASSQIFKLKHRYEQLKSGGSP